jgi:PAS domain S-box-containing protein
MAVPEDAVSRQGPGRLAGLGAGPTVAGSDWTAPIALIAIGIVVDIAIGQVVRNVLSLPVYLDSIGTILAGALGGPLVGALTGATANVLWGLLFNDPRIVPYAITAAAIGTTAGIAASLGAFSRPGWAVLAGLLTGVISAVVSAPISAHVNGGATGGGGQAVIGMLDQIGGNLMAAATLQSFLSDPIDKAISFAVVWLTLTALPADVTARLRVPERATRSYRSSWRYGVAGALSLLAVLIAILFWPATGRVILSVFYIAVVLSAWNGGLGPGLLATGFGAAAAVLLPLAAGGGDGFTVGDALNLCVFLTVSSLIALITEALDRVNHALGESLEEERRTEAEIRSLVDSVVETLVLVSPDGRIVSVNRRFEDLFGIPAGDVEGRSIDDLRPLTERLFADPETVMEHLAPSDGEVGERSVAIVAQTWPQERQLALFAAPVRSDGRELGTLYGFRDVTQERELDRMKTEFVSQVSHELRTPLTAIKGFTDLMLDGDAGDVNEEQTEYLGIVKSNADRLVALINDLLDVSRIEAGRIQLKPARLDLGPILEMVVATMRPLVEGKSQTLGLTVADDLPAAWGDHDRVVQVATNLVSNAHKYTQAGGSIEVSARAGGGFITVAVRDNGMGISPEDQARLFTRFFRVDNSLTREIGGTGLGLSIVKSIVEMQGGTVTLESAPGAGSTFAFTVPIATDQDSAARAAATNEPAAATGAAGAADQEG